MNAFANSNSNYFIKNKSKIKKSLFAAQTAIYKQLLTNNHHEWS